MWQSLELALWIESDRMGYLLDTIDEKGFANQQDVVRNERRQSVENRPYGNAEEELVHMLYPASHPYYASVIGSHAGPLVTVTAGYLDWAPSPPPTAETLWDRILRELGRGRSLSRTDEKQEWNLLMKLSDRLLADCPAERKSAIEDAVKERVRRLRDAAL